MAGRHYEDHNKRGPLVEGVVAEEGRGGARHLRRERADAALGGVQHLLLIERHRLGGASLDKELAASARAAAGTELKYVANATPL